jgi:hypothetical protein
VKVKLNDWPGARVGELRRPPESEVTVWGAESLFVHVTFVPVLTLSIAGLNANPLILIATTEGAGVVEVLGGVAGVGTVEVWGGGVVGEVGSGVVGT